MSFLSKYKIKGKTYYFVERLPNTDEDFINEMWRMENPKKEQFTLIITNRYKTYTLYDSTKKRIATAKHITEVF